MMSSRVLVETPHGIIALDGEGRMFFIEGDKAILAAENDRFVAAIWAITTASVAVALTLIQSSQPEVRFPISLN